MIRLSKCLQQAGVASRRKAEELIFEGKVKVNNTVVLKPETRVDPEKDRILVGTRPLTPPEKKVYYVLHKPKGKLSTSLESAGQKSVLSLFGDEGLRLFTVGRLDKDTEGLLIVTNDGDFAQKVIHPSMQKEKEYLAKVHSEISHEHLKKISEGTQVEGVFVKPLKVEKVRKGTLKITVGEGKKREVRLMLADAGLEVLSLCRIRLGSLVLGTLPKGAYRPLTPKEIEQLTNP